MKNTEGETVSALLAGRPEVLTVRETDRLALAGQMMAWARIRHLPVMRGDQVVGLISEGDLLRKQAREGGRRTGQLVAEAMNAPPVMTTPDADLAEASELMLSRRIGCLPVVSDSRLVGIITTSDVLAFHAGRRRLKAQPRSERRIVGEVMTRVPRTARPEESLLDAIARMAEAGIRHLPVVNENREVIGMLSDRDIRDLVATRQDAVGGRPATAEEAAVLKVADAMSAPALTVSEDEGLLAVTGDLIDQRVGAFAVVDSQGKLAGMLSYIDVLTMVYEDGRGQADQSPAMGVTARERRDWPAEGG